MITSTTEYFNEYEEKIYSDNTFGRKIICDNILNCFKTNIQKTIDPQKLKEIISSKGNAQKVNIKLKEYDMLIKLIKNFIEKGFKFVSFVFGGFKNIHDESLIFNIPLINHDETCFICRKKSQKSQKYGFMTKLFSKPKKDKNKQAKKGSFRNSKNFIINNREITKPHSTTFLAKSNLTLSTL